MSIEDDIYEVKEVVRNTSAESSFDRLQKVISGSAALEDLVYLVDMLLNDFVHNNSTSKLDNLSWPIKSDEEFAESVKNAIIRVRGH